VLQQEADHLVRVAVVRVVDLVALAEQGVGLVEEEDRAARLGGVEQPTQVLLRLADVLGDDRREVNERQVAREAPCGVPRRGRIAATVNRTFAPWYPQVRRSRA
jgi:hypothetical protein